MRQTKEQLIQEIQYNLPYHYVPSVDDGYFKPFIYWSWGINYMCSIEFLVEQIQKESFSKLIDVGCGDGRFVREISKRVKEETVIGVDISQRAINLARALNPELEFYRRDIRKDELPDDYDIVTLIEVIEHVPVDDVRPFLSSVADLQRDGGRLYITVPHSNRVTQKKHFQHFNSKSISEHLQPDYKVQEFFYFDKKTWYLKYLRGLMKNRFFILRHAHTLKLIYAYYKENIFFCSDESECSRLCAIAVKT